MVESPNEAECNKSCPSLDSQHLSTSKRNSILSFWSQSHQRRDFLAINLKPRKHYSLPLPKSVPHLPKSFFTDHLLVNCNYKLPIEGLVNEKNKKVRKREIACVRRNCEKFNLHDKSSFCKPKVPAPDFRLREKRQLFINQLRYIRNYNNVLIDAFPNKQKQHLHNLNILINCDLQENCHLFKQQFIKFNRSAIEKSNSKYSGKNLNSNSINLKVKPQTLAACCYCIPKTFCYNQYFYPPVQMAYSANNKSRSNKSSTNDSVAAFHYEKQLEADSNMYQNEQSTNDNNKIKLTIMNIKSNKEDKGDGDRRSGNESSCCSCKTGPGGRLKRKMFQCTNVSESLFFGPTFDEILFILINYLKYIFVHIGLLSPPENRACFCDKSQDPSCPTNNLDVVKWLHDEYLNLAKDVANANSALEHNCPCTKDNCPVVLQSRRFVLDRLAELLEKKQELETFRRREKKKASEQRQ